MTLSLDTRYEKIKYIYDESMKINSSNVVINHKDPETLKIICIVTPLDLMYLKDKRFIDITFETCGEVATGIQVRDALIEYMEERR